MVNGNGYCINYYNKRKNEMTTKTNHNRTTIHLKDSAYGDISASGRKKQDRCIYPILQSANKK
jgi:hypothetical protein